MPVKGGGVPFASRITAAGYLNLRLHDHLPLSLFFQVVLVIDALDEASSGSSNTERMDPGNAGGDDGDDGGNGAGGSDGRSAPRNELLALINDCFKDLPRWVRFVITTRPKDEREGVPEENLLEALKDFKPMTVEVRCWGSWFFCLVATRS